MHRSSCTLASSGAFHAQFLFGLLGFCSLHMSFFGHMPQCGWGLCSGVICVEWVDVERVDVQPNAAVLRLVSCAALCTILGLLGYVFRVY